jgi:hypothetical protein
MTGQLDAGVFLITQRPGELGNGSIVHCATILKTRLK